MKSLLETIMIKFGFTKEEAEAEIEEAQLLLRQYLEDDDWDLAYEIGNEMWGLEPAYLVELT